MTEEKERELEKKKKGILGSLDDIEIVFESVQGSKKLKSMTEKLDFPNFTIRRLGHNSRYFLICLKDAEEEAYPTVLKRGRLASRVEFIEAKGLGEVHERHIVAGSKGIFCSETDSKEIAELLNKQRGKEEMILVAFPEGDKKESEKGYSLLLHSGTVIYTKNEWEYIVSAESVEMLKKAGIKYSEKGIGGE